MYPFKRQECRPVRNLQANCSSGKDDITNERIMDQGDGSEIVRKQEEEELGLSGDNLIYENLALKNELKWRVRPYLVHHFKHMFSFFKQHYTYFYTFFHLHIFPKKLKTVV